MDEDRDIAIDGCYDGGWRAGIFDKCNGRSRQTRQDHPECVENTIWFDGYDDAYDSHERMI